MRGRMMRRMVFALAITLWWLLLLAWAAGGGLSTPWSPAQQRAFEGRQLNIVMGGDSSSGADGVRVASLGNFDQTLQSWRLAEPLAASDFRWLRYRVDGFPRTLELDLVFRTSERSNDVSIYRLPWPRDGQGVFDLATLPSWQGSIIELGFSEFDAAGELPPGIAFPPFVIRSATLQSASWRAALASLRDQWLGYRPATMRMINTVRAGDDVVARCSLVLMLALGVAGSLVLAATLGGVRRRRLAVLAVTLAVAAWLALDMVWLLQWQQRNAVTRTVFAGKPWAERAGMVPDRDLYLRAGRLHAVLAEQPPGQHILLWTPGKGQTIRLSWFLRPLNTSLLNLGSDPAQVPDGTLLLVDNSDNRWHFDARGSRLQHSGFLASGEQIFHSGLDDPLGAQEPVFQLPGDLIYRSGDYWLLSARKGAGP